MDVPVGTDAELETLIEAVLPGLAGIGVEQLGWLLAQPWPESWITGMGFEQVNAITTYVLSDLSARPAATADPGIP